MKLALGEGIIDFKIYVSPDEMLRLNESNINTVDANDIETMDINL
jgi:hypothetical protein